MPRKMRQSGVDWIGDIPEGWKVMRFKHVATSLRKGKGITKEDVFADGDLPCIRYGEIYSRYGFTVDRCASKTRRNLLPDPVFVVSGDILFACTGERLPGWQALRKRLNKREWATLAPAAPQPPNVASEPREAPSPAARPTRAPAAPVPPPRANGGKPAFVQPEFGII